MTGETSACTQLSHFLMAVRMPSLRCSRLADDDTTLQNVIAIAVLVDPQSYEQEGTGAAAVDLAEHQPLPRLNQTEASRLRSCSPYLC